MSPTVGAVDTEFEDLVRRHERELHVHCYRMLGSFEAAEDLVQETFLRAWRGRTTVDTRTGLRAWLYRIATNACLDELRRTARQPTDSLEVTWLQPYPDHLLDQVAPSGTEPDAVTVDRETIGLAYLVAVQLLPPRQRAVLLLRDVLGWSAAETAEALDLSVASANSALQRARAALRDRLPAQRSDWAVARPSAEERDLALRFIDAHEKADVAASLAIASADIRITMPPHPWCYQGIDALRPMLAQAYGDGALGSWRLLPVAANRQAGAASYLLAPGDTEYRPFKLDILRAVAGRIAEITTFDATLFPAFGLPTSLPAVAGSSSTARSPGARPDTPER